jgi:stage V sporulation protein SpoVS
VDLVCVPTFADIEIEGQGRTAIRLLVEHRDRLHASIAAGARLSVDVKDRAGASPSVVSGAREAVLMERALSTQPAD